MRATIFMLATLLLTTGATTASSAPRETQHREGCSVLSVAEAASILHEDVTPPDGISRSHGACIYASRDISRGDELSFFVVTPADIAKVRETASFALKTCAHAPQDRAIPCARYKLLSHVTSIAQLYTARTAATGIPVDGLGDEAAIVTDTSALLDVTRVVVREDQRIIEAEITINDRFDKERSIALAKLLLERTMEH